MKFFVVIFIFISCGVLRADESLQTARCRLELSGSAYGENVSEIFQETLRVESDFASQVIDVNLRNKRLLEIQARHLDKNPNSMDLILADMHAASLAAKESQQTKVPVPTLYTESRGFKKRLADFWENIRSFRLSREKAVTEGPFKEVATGLDHKRRSLILSLGASLGVMAGAALIPPTPPTLVGSISHSTTLTTVTYAPPKLVVAKAPIQKVMSVTAHPKTHVITRVVTHPSVKIPPRIEPKVALQPPAQVKKVKSPVVARDNQPKAMAAAPVHAVVPQTGVVLGPDRDAEKISGDDHFAYTEAARHQNFNGQVAAILNVDKSGNVLSVSLRNKNPGLGIDEMILSKIKTWKFRPAIKDGKAVAAKFEITVNLQRS